MHSLIQSSLADSASCGMFDKDGSALQDERRLVLRKLHVGPPRTTDVITINEGGNWNPVLNNSGLPQSRRSRRAKTR